MVNANMAASSFSLDDEAADQFFTESPYQEPVPRLSSFQQSSPVEQFEVDDSQTSYVARAYAYADLRRYTNLFEVSAADVYSRCLRASFPYCGLFVPPPSPDQSSAEESDSSSDEDEEAGWGQSEFEGGGDSTQLRNLPPTQASRASNLQSMASPEPFNTEPDLYGATWVPVTLILATSMGSNAYEMIRSVISGQDAYHGTRLAALDFSGLVSAASGVAGFVSSSSIAVYLLKPYLGDPETVSLAYTFCVYGYSLSPLVPAVLLSAVVRGWWTWLVIGLAVLCSLVTVLRNLWPETDFVPAALKVGREITAESDANHNIGQQTRVKLWWLRSCVIGGHLLAGLLLKLRFF